MILVDRPSIAYLAVGKTGSYSVWRWMHGKFPTARIHQQYHDVDRSQLAKRFVFANVRHPVTRMLSLWDWLRRRPKNYMHRYAKMPFQAFIHWHCSKRNPDVLRVPTFCEMTEGIELNAVLRFELLQRDFARLPFVPKGSNLKHWHRGTRGEETWRTFYDESTLAIVQEWGRADIERFRYKKEP